MSKQWRYAVTFEAPESRPPVVVRGEIAAGGAQTAASRAIREARRAQPGVRYESLVVLLERIK